MWKYYTWKMSNMSLRNLIFSDTWHKLGVDLKQNIRTNCCSCSTVGNELWSIHTGCGVQLTHGLKVWELEPDDDINILSGSLFLLPFPLPYWVSILCRIWLHEAFLDQDVSWQMSLSWVRLMRTSHSIGQMLHINWLQFQQNKNVFNTILCNMSNKALQGRLEAAGSVWAGLRFGNLYRALFRKINDTPFCWVLQS